MTSSGPADGLPGGYPSGEYDPAFSVNLGPEGSMSAPTDQDLAMQVSTRFLGETRYPEHNQRMLELLDSFDLSTPGLEMTVALHDVADHGLINPKDESRKREAQNLIYELWDDVEDTGQLYYALGCALSSGYWEEEVGETWRYMSTIDMYSDRDKEEQSQIDAAIRGDSSVDIDEDVLKTAGAYDLDTTSLLHAMEAQNVEGLIVHGIEQIENFNNPPPDNPASTWRDAIETLSCYSPALTFFSFKKLATMLRGKALEFFYDGTDAYKKAQERNLISTRHFREIDGIFKEALTEAVTTLEGERQEALDMDVRPQIKAKLNESSLEATGGIKTVGSAAKKFLDPKYEDLDMLPDGIRFRVVVPDSIGGVGAILLGAKMKEIITEKYGLDQLNEIYIEVDHPHPDEPAEEDYITNPRGEYQSYHVVFTAHMGEDIVPFEIQTVTREQEWLHTWSHSSEVTRKTGSEVTTARLDDMRHMGRRARHLTEKPLNRELVPNSWIDITKTLPDLPSAVNNAYSLVETYAARIMTPPEIKDIVASELDARGLDDDIFLPPTVLSVEDFNWMISQIDPTLEFDEQIQDAISFLTDQDLPLRRSGERQLQGHLLPVAFHAGIMAALSSRHWDSVDPSKFLSNTVTATLLHDVVEDTEGDKEEMMVRIRANFGDNIANTVDALSSPDGPEDDHERHSAYAEQLDENFNALIIKLSDRMQNHISDLALLSSTNPSEEEVQRIKDYFKETHNYLSPLFDADKIPYEYRQVHKTVMALGKSIFPDAFEE